MIITVVNTVAYRVHHPKWAYAPISGTGAGTHGGRVNRPGVNALYLSLELETALAEYKQVDAVQKTIDKYPIHQNGTSSITSAEQ